METDATLHELLVSNDSMSLLLNCELDLDLFEITVQGILEEIKQLKVTPQPTEEAIKAVFQDSLMNGTPVKNAVVVAGIPAGESIDARVEWCGDYFNTQFAVDPETGKIDYRRRLGHPNVRAGDVLGRLYPHSEGEPGANIFGKRVPARKPNKLKITGGRNVETTMDDKGIKTFTSTAAGRVRRQGEALLVDDVLMIGGDVGLESGDLEHPGAILIQGDVLAGATIRAGGDIEVQGLVEAATIETSGGLAVRMGIHGGGTSNILLGGNLHARFISEAELIVDGDVVVESEITQCRILCSGAVNTPSGRIVGGVVRAFGGVKAAQIGSPSHTRTIIEVAHDIELEGRLAPVREALEHYEEQGERLRKSIRPFEQRRKDLQREQLAMLVKLEKMLEEIERATHEKRTKISVLIAESRQKMVEEIQVNRMLYPESMLQIGKVFRAVTERMDGPLCVQPHHKESLVFMTQRSTDE